MSPAALAINDLDRLELILEPGNYLLAVSIDDITAGKNTLPLACG
jgi:hypothetical protein